MTNMLSLNIRHSLAYSPTNHIAAIALENSINQSFSTFEMMVRTWKDVWWYRTWRWREV